MAILLFAQKNTPIDDNLQQAVLTARFIESSLDSYYVLVKEPIIIVVPNAEGDISTQRDDHKGATEYFLGKSEIQVQTLSELKANIPPTISCALEIGYGASFWKKDQGLEVFLKQKNIPVLHLPDYNMRPEKDTLLNYVPQLETSSEILDATIYGGFDEAGIIRDDSLLAATADESLLPQKIAEAFKGLDPQLKKFLGNDWTIYRQDRNFSCQFSSEDRQEVRVLVNKNPYQVTEYTTAQLFFLEHIAFTSNSTQSQDVLCLGKWDNEKRTALLKCKDLLINQGYTKITFINVDETSEKEETLYQNPSSSQAYKEYRVLCFENLSYSTRRSLPLLSEGIIGGTGDHFGVHAMAAGKLLTYECLPFKKSFALGYLKKVQEKTQDPAVISLAELLIKPINQRSFIPYDEAKVIPLLKNKTVTDALQKINRELVVESQYNETVMNRILPCLKKEILKKEEAEQVLSNNQIILLKTLSKYLLDTVNKNKRKSSTWEKRHQAATEIFNRVHDKNIVLKELDALFIRVQLEIIKNNKPSWKEHHLAIKILDVISLGVSYLIRNSFFPDITMSWVKKMEKTIPASSLPKLLKP